MENMFLDKKGKRYNRKDIDNSLKKLVMLGFVKKIKISSTDVYYDKISHPNPEDYVGFVNNLIFSSESQVKVSLKKLQGNNIFVDISKNPTSYKLDRFGKPHYEKLLNAVSGMTELSSAISLVKEISTSEKLQKQLSVCYDEIMETLDQTNEKIISNRNSNEIILLQRSFSGRIPNVGYLKL